MSHNHELENQDLRTTTMGDISSSINLPREELPEQDLEAVSGGFVTAVPTVINETTENPNPGAESIEDPLVGGLVDAPIAAGNTADNLFG